MRLRVQFPPSPLKATKMEVTAIVPCYNEEKTLGDVLNALTASPRIKMVIVVDDGSIDGSLDVARRFKIQLIKNRRNLGKGGSIRKAVAMVKTKFVMMCDADLKGLRQESIDALLHPLERDENTMAVGLRDKGWHLGSKVLKEKLMLVLIGGERAMLTRHLMAVCRDKRTAKYGLEPVMNSYCTRKGIRIVKVGLKGVNDTSKLRKRGRGLVPFIEETVNVVGTYAKLRAEDAQRMAGKMKNGKGL